MLVGLGVGLAITAVVAAVVLGGDSADDAQGARTVPEVSRTVGSRSSTTTTSTTTTSGPSAAVVPPSTARTTPPTTAGRVAPPASAAVPRATASPSTPVYSPVGLPTGVAATISACSWQPAGGGQYQASGTLTNGPQTIHGWTITIHWLQNGREVGRQSALVDIAADQSRLWSLAMGASTAPADPFSCALSVE